MDNVKPLDVKGFVLDLVMMNKDFSQAHPFLKSFQSHCLTPDVSGRRLCRGLQEAGIQLWTQTAAKLPAGKMAPLSSTIQFSF